MDEIYSLVKARIGKVHDLHNQLNNDTENYITK